MGSNGQTLSPTRREICSTPPAVFFHGREEIGRLAKQIKKIIKRTLQGKNKNHDIIS